MTTWCGEVPVRDDFGQIIVGTFIDGKTKQGPWTIMTLGSFAQYGVGLGAGFGQKYRYNQESKTWDKIEG